MALFAPALARAQTPATLEQAREIFGKALADENAGRYDAALEKYRMVLTVKETPSVRFRIGACLKAQKKLVEARDAFAGVQGPAGNAVATSPLPVQGRNSVATITPSAGTAIAIAQTVRNRR